MKDYLVYGVIVIFAVLVRDTVGGTELQCYQCNPVTEECEDNKADIVNCGSVSMSRCSRQVKKDSIDSSRAIRKCVITDKSGNVNCPVDYKCYNCAHDLCNSNPIIAGSSGFVVKSFWGTIMAVISVLFYI